MQPDNPETTYSVESESRICGNCEHLRPGKYKGSTEHFHNEVFGCELQEACMGVLAYTSCVKFERSDFSARKTVSDRLAAIGRDYGL